MEAVSADSPSFDELVDLLRIRLRDADAVNAQELHSFKELMRDHADVVADNWYSGAFEELQAQGHLHQASLLAFGGDAHARLSADGRLYLALEDPRLSALVRPVRRGVRCEAQTGRPQAHGGRRKSCFQLTRLRAPRQSPVPAE
jgi:hypothetical protein